MPTILDTVLPPVADALRPFLRQTFVPVVAEDDPEGPVSKLGGRPWLPDGESWPTCVNCLVPLQLFLQLDLDALPEGAQDHGHGLAQLFYCTSDEPICAVECEAYLPFSDCTLARVVDPRAPGMTAPLDLSPHKFPARAIVGWEAREDLPSADELSEHGLDLDDHSAQILSDAEMPRAGDKLDGWPYWVQGLEYPSCPTCGATMRLLFQIDSEDNLPYMFGDTGCAHLTQCPEHPEVLAFAWACC